MTDDPSAIRDRARLVLDAGTVLRARPVEARARWLADATAAFAPNAALGKEARETLPAETGSSSPMVSWALRTTFDTVNYESLLGLFEEAHEAAGMRRDPISLLSVVLAGNVFTASVRAIVVPLLFGVPVLVKAASSETLFPTLLERALREADPELANAIGLVIFSGDDDACNHALLEFAEVASVYGTDETIDAMAGRIGGRIPVVPHGHGVSVAYCDARALVPTTIDETVSRIAVDIAAYDQRGCLSPQVIYVQRDPETPLDDLAAHLSGALEALSERLPRGPLPDAVGAAQTQWRGVAEVEASLVGGHEHALSVRNDQVIHWSPGYRNVTLVAVDDLEGALGSMASFARHLKCIGADPSSLHALETQLASHASLRAYAAALGSMQTPALDAPADGRPVWENLLRTSRS